MRKKCGEVGINIFLLYSSPAFLGFTCPPVDNNSIYFGGETRFFRSPADCQHYFVCVEGRPRLQNCGEGNAFNELVNTCDAAENVTGW